MGRQWIILLFILPSFAFADSKAEKACSEALKQIQTQCREFTTDDGLNYASHFDLMDFQLNPVVQNPFQGDQVSLVGSRCRNRNLFRYMIIVYKKDVGNGQNQCVTQRFYTNTEDQEFVEERIYVGNNVLTPSTYRDEDFSNRPRNRATALEPVFPDRNPGFIERNIGRPVTNLIDRAFSGDSSPPER